MMNVRSAGIVKPAAFASCCGAIATVSGVRCASSSHITRRSASFSCVAREVAAFLLQLREHRARRSTLSMIRLPSAEQPEPKSDVFDSRVLRAASSMFAVSSMIIVELPAPTP